MITGHLIPSLAAAFVIFHTGLAAGQDALPAPAPEAAPPAKAAPPPFPSGGTGPLTGNPRPPDACMSGFVRLRHEAERRGRLVKAAADRKAPREEACKLVSSFGEAENRMVTYVETNAARCAIQQQIVEKLRDGRKKTEALQQKICAAVPQVHWRSPDGLVRVSGIGDPENRRRFRFMSL